MRDFCPAGMIVPLLIGALILSPPLVSASPVGGKVAAGKATISQPNGQTLNINQLTDKAIINWKGFSINVNELVKFTQPKSTSVVLNRVTGIEPSSILGRLVANGRVFIVNPNGVLFGANSVVDVAGLLATTLNIKDSEFMAGRFNFAQDPKKELSYAINNGQIKVSDNGFVFLVAPGVANNGLIIANLGKVVMGAGEKFTVDFMGDGLITFALEGKVLDQVTGPDGAPLPSAVSNTGTIKADGGQVILTARASSEIFSSVVNQSGIIEAHSLVNRGGVIRLEGSDPVANTGEIGWRANLGKVKNAEGAVINTGTLDVSAAQPGAAPGEVTLSGQSIGVSGTILAKGAAGARGGQVLITSSDKTVVTGNSLIDTSGVGNSSAGNVVVWSDKDTIYRGGILAQGGKLGGDGGNVEVSGHENLLFAGNANTLAPNGTMGTLLLDPRNITVATAGATTTDQVDQFSDTPGTDQTIAPATIDAVAANVVLQANTNITVTNSIAMTTPGASLTMQAGRDINVNANVSTTNGAISLTANDSTAISANRFTGAGDIIMAAGTTLSSGSGNIALAIGPSATAPFSPGNITARTLTTTGGSILLGSPNAVTMNEAVNAGAGTVTIAANGDGSGSQAFTMAAGSSITTTNATASAVQINVNAPGGGTGAAALRSISTGSGGTLTVATNTGGNATGGDITQTAATLLNVGTGTISLATPAIASANIGSSGANILTTAGTITASSGTSGVFITESDGADFTATATGAGAIRLTSATGLLAIAGPTSTGSGAITLTAETVDINAPLSSTGNLTLLPVNAAGNLTVSSSASSNLTDGFSSIITGNAAGTGAATVNALTVSDPLTIRSPTTTGTVTVNGPITGLGNATVALTGGTGATPITLNAGISTAGRTITLSDNVALGADVILDSTNAGASPTGATISVTGTINADAAANNRSLTLAGGTAGNVTLSGPVGGAEALQSLTVTSANALTVPAVTTTGDIQLNAVNAVTLSGAVDAGSGTVTIAANTDGAGSSVFTMGAGSSITTTNATANAVQINVNASGGGTGAAALRNITTGSGGTLTVATNTGGNVTGGDITQTAATLLDVGTGSVSLTTPAITSANIGSSGANILTTAGTITASSGTSGVFITESDGADFTATASGAGAIALKSNTGTLAIAGPTSTGSGAITLTAETVNINAPLSSTGALTLLPVTAAGNLTVSSSAPNHLTDGFGSIIIGNAAGTGAVTVNALTASDPLTIRSPTTTGTVTVNGPITGLGNATVALTGGTGATPIVLNAGISTTGRTITLSDNVSLGADVTLDSTNAGASPAGATIRVTGTINADAAANNRTLTLLAGTAGNITLGGPMGGTASLGGFAATANSIALPASITTSGNIALTSAGDLTINTLTSTAGGIDLTATAGSILDGNGAANNLTAAANSTLRGLGGVVGLITDPIEVGINPGTLGVAATGQVAGVSVNIDGTVLPSNTLDLLNSPPGLVLFNGRILSGSSSTVANLIRATSDLNPQRVNEFGPFTELLLHVLSDNYFEEKSGNCEMDEELKKERKDSGC